MNFSCNKSRLLREITIANEIISGRSSLSMLSNVLLEVKENSLIIKASDLKVTFESKIEIQVFEEGITTIFCDKLVNVLRNLPETDIDFIKKDDILIIKPVGQKIDFKLRCMDSDKYPELSKAKDNSYFEMSQNNFTNMINQTIFAVSDDPSRYFLNGIYCEKVDNNLVMVSTDGRRLSYINFPVDKLDSLDGVIIPTKILNLVRKLSSLEGNISIAIEDKTIYIKLGNQLVSSTLIDGKFPQYGRITSETPERKAIINRSKLLTAIKRVSLLAEDKSKRIFLTISESKVTLSSENTGIGNAKEDIICEYNGPETSIALNYEYLVDPLKSIDELDIDLCFTDETRPVMIYSSPRTNYLHMIQPMQID